MPAHTFGPEWLDPLLRGDKQGTTRPQSGRIKVGDIVSIYIQQRRRITDKPVRQMTGAGTTAIANRVNDPRFNYPAECPILPRGEHHEIPYYYAHFIGKVKIDDVYDIHPCEMTGEELEAWAWADGFDGFHPTGVFPEQLCSLKPGANEWFMARYGDEWMQRWWTVERWHGWVERYFEPAAL